MWNFENMDLMNAPITKDMQVSLDYKIGNDLAIIIPLWLDNRGRTEPDTYSYKIANHYVRRAIYLYESLLCHSDVIAERVPVYIVISKELLTLPDVSELFRICDFPKSRILTYKQSKKYKMHYYKFISIFHPELDMFNKVLCIDADNFVARYRTDTKPLPISESLASHWRTSEQSFCLFQPYSEGCAVREILSDEKVANEMIPIFASKLSEGDVAFHKEYWSVRKIHYRVNGFILGFSRKQRTDKSFRSFLKQWTPYYISENDQALLELYLFKKYGSNPEKSKPYICQIESLLPISLWFYDELAQGLPKDRTSFVHINGSRDFCLKQ